MGAAATATMCSSQPGSSRPCRPPCSRYRPASPISSYDPASFGFLHDLSPGPTHPSSSAPLICSPRPPAPPRRRPLWDLFNHF
ncbi:nuclear speckle RNA-binding protein B-like [Iris pallida]|uniref:Nuclear speckle RNA-binding protein B-like n=1 Tax=Iris pallida TaxID=29817 RepID=A0AAX6IJY0_IRIPA|nr:nuclear speckle RNA-binding protein B-like [Iris pallida]